MLFAIGREMSFPHLKADIEAAPIVLEGEYKFRAFSAGERGTNISPELSREVRDGLLEAVMSFCLVDEIDSIVSIHVTGAMWALSVAIKLNKPLKLFTTEPNGTAEQYSFTQKRPYLPRLVYTPDLKQVGQCIIIDDVLNRGSTIIQMKTEIEKAGGKVLGAVCVIDKLASAKTLTEKFGIPVIALECVPEQSRV